MGIRYGDAWEIENIESPPLRIDAVLVNGEWDAPVGSINIYGVLSRDGRSFPVTISVGESVLAYVWQIGDRSSSYSKDVVFVDIYTDRGNARYRPSDDVGIPIKIR